MIQINPRTSESKVTAISQSHTLDEMVEFWGFHSTADFDDQTHEVEIEFNASARLNRVAIEPELMHDLWEIAEQRRISVETLVCMATTKCRSLLAANTAPIHQCCSSVM